MKSFLSTLFFACMLVAVGIGLVVTLRLVIHSEATTDEPITLYDYVALGDELFQEQRYSEALFHYEQAARLDTQNALPRWRAGQLYQLKNRYAEATTELQIAHRLDESNADILFRLGTIYYQTREWQQATDTLYQAEQLVELSEEEAVSVASANLSSADLGRLYLYQGQSLVWLERIEEAEDYLRQAIELDSENWVAHHWYGLVLSAGDLDAGVNHLTELINAHNLSGEPIFPKMQTAIEDLRSTQNLSDSVLQRMQQANTYLRQSMPTLALPILLSVTTDVPDYQSGRSALGRAYFLVGELARAEEELERSLTLGAGPTAATYAYLGDLRFAQTEYREASEHFDQAYQLGDESFETFYQLGQSLANLSEFSKAARSYERALQVEPDNLRARTSLVNVYLTRLKDTSAAELVAEQGIDHDDSVGRHYDLLGWVLIEQGDEDEAQQVLERALELDPGIASAHFNLATLYEKQGNEEKAEESYRLALELDFEGDIAPLANEALQRLRIQGE